MENSKKQFNLPECYAVVPAAGAKPSELTVPVRRSLLVVLYYVFRITGISKLLSQLSCLSVVSACTCLHVL